MRPILALDLDGTLLEYRSGLDFENHAALQSLRPLGAVVTCALAWQRAGFRLEIITGRSEASRSITEQQVQDLLGKDVPVWMQDAWRGPSNLLEHKIRHMKRPGIVAFVGDGHLDQRAAAIAGIQFWWPEQFVMLRKPDPQALLAGAAALGVGRPAPAPGHHP